MLTVALLGAAAADASAQGRWERQDRRDRNSVARAQGIPPGHMPPAHMCRVWYANRPNGQQPAPATCRQAEVIASRNRNARVIYGENQYYGNAGYGDRYPETRDPRDRDDRGVYRVPGRNRDPRANDPSYRGDDPYYRGSRYTTPAFQNGYRDGLDKGREDGDDNDRYDPNRHSWYRSATRGYENEYGSRNEYQVRYREGFEAGYAEGYRAYNRR
jgi:hypothetical protein